MGTVGINFGSASSGAGFDVSATVTSILAIESGVETPWKAQLTILKARDTALSSLGTNLASLSTALGSLTAFDGVTAAKQGSRSDSSMLRLRSASAAAIAGSHTVVVTSLASTASKYSDTIANPTDTLSGSLTLQVGSGTSHTLTLDASNNTLRTLASSINNGSFGVTASVVSDTQGSRLSLVSNTSGAAGQFTLSASLSDQVTTASVAFATGQNGVDAQLTVDGLATTSAANTVTGAIPGVTFQLLQAAPSSALQVQITNDNSSVVTAVQSFVTAYNAVATGITAQEGKDASGNPEPLYGDPTLALLQGQLAGALNGGKSNGSISSIEQLGLTVNADGTLSFDESTLQSTLNVNYSDVTGFLQNPGSFGQNLTTTLNGLSSTDRKGALYLVLQGNAAEETSLNANVTTEDARVAENKINLTTELNMANQILQSIPSQLNQVNEIYSAVTGYNQSH